MKDLTQGKESKVIWQFAMPILFGNALQQLYNIVDSIIIGHYIGKEALAAVGASFPIFFTLISVVIGFAAGATVIVSQFFGAKKIDQVKRTIDTVYIVLFVAAIALSLLGIGFAREIFAAIKLPQDIMPYAILYMNIYLGGLIFFFGFNGTSAILRGLGDSKTPLYFLLVSTLTNIGFDLLFVIVFKWGIAGVAIATIISQAGAFITAILYLNKYHQIIQFNFLQMIFDVKIFKESLRIGLPSGIQQAVVALGMLALFWIVNGFGTDVVAAFSVAMRVEGLAVMPALAFGAAIGAFVGQNVGAQKLDRVYGGIWSTIKLSGLVTIMVSLVAIVFPHELMSVFTSEEMVIYHGANYLRISGMFYTFFTILFVFNGALRGAGDTLIPMLITFTSLWIFRLPLTYYLSTIFDEIGIWWGSPIGWFFGMLLSMIYFYTGRWKKKGVLNKISGNHTDQS